MALPSIDLIDPDTYARSGPPHEQFERLRHEAPVYRHPHPDGGYFWAVTRYRDVEHVSLDWRTFSSARGGVLLREFADDEVEFQRSLLINMDAPLHTKFRKIVNLGFAPKRLRDLEGHVRDMARTIVDNIAERGACDFVTDVAAELPLQVILEMLGVPLADRHKVFDWSNTMIGADDPEYNESGTPEAGKIAAMQLYAYFNDLALERRDHPRDDLVSLLMNATVDGERLTENEFDQFVLLLSVAGNETTRNLISGGMLALFEHPAEYARLRADRSLLPTAVDEMLRWVSAVNFFRRTAQRDVELAGQPLREGDRVILFYASANRDETVFPEADRFDVGRSPNEHLAFGFGPHFCLGAHLARLEIRIMFEELLDRLPDLRAAGPVERLRSSFINGIKHLPVRFTPARRLAASG
jgi:cholest-4-en-3-one 26-monooxygenase